MLHMFKMLVCEEIPVTLYLGPDKMIASLDGSSLEMDLADVWTSNQNRTLAKLHLHLLYFLRGNCL